MLGLSLLWLTACDSEKGVTVFNAQPEAVITSHRDGDVVEADVPIVFRGVASDPNHSYVELSATWFSGERELCSAVQPESDGVVQCEAVLGEQDSDVRLEVQDPINGTGSARVILTLQPTEPPQGVILEPLSADKHYSDQKITFAARLSDAEDTPESLQAYWSSDIDGILSAVSAAADSSGETEGFGYLSEGEHAIQLHVEDSSGKTDTDSVIVTVGPPNSAPSCEILSPMDGSFHQEGEALRLEGFVSDVDVDASALSVRWLSSQDGEIGISIPDGSGQVVIESSALSLNTHQLSLEVTDDVGAVCVDSIVIDVGNPPTIAIQNPVDAEVYSEGEVLIFSAMASDDVDDPQDLALEWYLNGNLVQSTSPNNTGLSEWSDSTLTYGSYQLEVTAQDSTGFMSSAQLSFVINALPTAPVVYIDPNQAYTDDALNVVIDAASVDPEGQSVSYSYAWFKDGALQPSLINPHVPDSDTGKGELWRVEVTPSDGLAAGPIGEASVVISNTEPIVSAVSIQPSSPVYNDSVLSCVASISDPDESIAPTFEWFVDGQSVASGATIDLSLFSVWVNAIVTCEVTAVDSDGASASAEANAVVENRLPTVLSVVLSPSTPSTNDLVQATASASDPDNHQGLSLAYDWHVISALTGADTVVQASSSAVLDGGLHFDKNDQIYVDVYAFDGEGVSAPLSSASILVVNSPPTEPHISIMPTEPSAGGDDLICTIDIVSQDEDGDSVVYAIVWTDPNGLIVQSGSSTALSDTLSGALTTEGLWTCTVTASDGFDSSNAVSATVDVVEGCGGLSGPLYSAAGVDFACAPSGTFEMGSDPNNLGAATDEAPHSVSLTYPFWISTTEVTEAVFLSLMGYNPSLDTLCGADCPVEKITWSEAAAFTNALSLADGFEPCYRCSGSGSSIQCQPLHQPYLCSGYRLPTEAEWEFAARAGTQGDFQGGANLLANTNWNDHCPAGILLDNGGYLEDFSWYCGASGGYVSNNIWYFKKPVGLLQPNDWGLYDMSGNLWEYTNDWYTADLGSAPVTNPLGASLMAVVGGTVRKGGSGYQGNGSARGSRLATRATGVQNWTRGIRVVRSQATDVDNDGIDQFSDCDDMDANIQQAPTGRLESCAASSCDALLNDGFATEDGVYWIDPDGTGAFEAYCDMTTAGGGWTLILNYLRTDAVYRSVEPLNSTLPIPTAQGLGVSEGGVNGQGVHTDFAWGHATPGLLSRFGISELRFYCESGRHSRIIHFTTSHQGSIDYVQSGQGSMNGIQNSFAPMSDHTGYLPAAGGEFFANEGDLAMTRVPFHDGGSANWHWLLDFPGGSGIRWECDDWDSDPGADQTLHRIWMR